MEKWNSSSNKEIIFQVVSTDQGYRIGVKNGITGKRLFQKEQDAINYLMDLVSL